MDRRIIRVRSVLDEQYRDPPSVDQLAETVGLSASRLAHLFRTEIGMSIQAYVIERRLLMAAQLIAPAHEQVSPNAYRAGFGGTFNFNHPVQLRVRILP